MKKTMKFAGAASVLALAIAGTTANADALTQLYFSQEAGFVDPSTDGVAATGYNPAGGGGLTPVADDPDCSNTSAPGGTYEGLSWNGTTSSSSSICVNTYNTETSNTAFGNTGTSNAGVNVDQAPAATGEGEWNEGELWVISELIQENNVINGTQPTFPEPLWIADVLADFAVYADSTGGSEVILEDPGTTRLEFWESWNLVTWDQCDPTDPYESDPIPGAGPCADRYRTNANDFADIWNDYNGYRYTISFALTPGPVSAELNGDELGLTKVEFVPCNPAEPLGDLCIDAFTPEIAPGFSRIYVTASWSARAIPEPSVLALFGAGILGLGLAGRRRKQLNPS